MQIPLLCVGDGDDEGGADEGAADGAEADVGAVVDWLTLGEGCTSGDNAEDVVGCNA